MASLPGPKILIGVAFALLVGATVLAFFSGVPLPLIGEGQEEVLGFFDQAMALMGC